MSDDYDDDVVFMSCFDDDDDVVFRGLPA